jgi:AsmA protein
MKSRSKKAIAIAAAFVFVALWALPHLVDIDRFRPQLELRLKSALGREVHLGHMEISLLAGGARVNQLSIADDPAFHRGSFLEAKSLGVGVSLLSLIFSHSLHVTSITLEEPHMVAIESADGKWNFSSLGSTENDDENAEVTESLAPSVTSVVLDHLKISNATIEMSSSEPGNQPMILKNIDVDLKNASFDSAMSFALSAHSDSGKLEIHGEAGPLNHADPDQTPFHVSIEAKRADLAQIAWLGSSPALSGILSVDGTITSDGNTIHSEGKISGEKLHLIRNVRSASQTVSLRYETDFDVAGKTGVIRDGEIAAGKSAASLAGSYEREGENLIVHIKIAGNHLALDNVESVLAATGIDLSVGSKIHGGTVSANVAFDGPINRLVTSGNAEIANAHLSAFDLGSKMSALPGMSALKNVSDFPIVNLNTHFRVSPQSTEISGFNGQFSGIGKITGGGEVTASHRLEFKMVAHMPSDGAVRFGLNHVGLRNLPNDIPFQVVGTTSSPMIIPDLSAMRKNATKTVAKSFASNTLKEVSASQRKTQASAPAQSGNKKKGGFFHKLFKGKV